MGVVLGCAYSIRVILLDVYVGMLSTLSWGVMINYTACGFVSELYYLKLNFSQKLLLKSLKNSFPLLAMIYRGTLYLKGGTDVRNET